MAHSLGRANPNTIQDKLLVGYQGWFTCAGDGAPIGPGHHGWLHWFDAPIPDGGRPNTDLWPDTSSYDPAELYPAPGLATASGDPVYLFSSRNPKTVRRHFHWMALHGVDGAFLQRFAGQCEIKPGNHGIRDLRDEVGQRVREAAEAEGRVFAIMYDVSGVAPDKIQSILEQDWRHLLGNQRVLDSPSYLRENGRPVVALWGFGFNGRNHTPDLVREIAEFFRSNTPGGVYLVAGAPGHWRTSTSDADRNPEFVQVWTGYFDAISPWTVGRYGNEEEADRWGEERVKADADYLKNLQARGGRSVDYMPVVLPGGSGFNLSCGKWGMNDIRRNGGRFLWRQLYNAQRAGARTIYCAMWDEYDEGTVFMPVVSHASQVPVHPAHRFIALDVDGHDLPSDWYMRIAGLAAEALHGKRPLSDTFPDQELRDYWQTRPRDVARMPSVSTKQPDSAVDDVTRAMAAWQVSGGVPGDAPPPYSVTDAHVSSPRVGGGGAGKPPPVPRSTRPFSPSLPPRVAATSRPVVGSVPPPPPASTRPYVPPAGPPPLPAKTGMPPTPTWTYAPPTGPPPRPAWAVGGGRARSRSKSPHGHGHGHRARSRSRSKSPHGHGHKHKHGHRARSRSKSPHGYGHGHAQSLPPAGPSHAYSGSYGEYAPPHVAPGGWSGYGPYGPEQGYANVSAYAGPGAYQGGYDPAYGGPGYGHGQGYGYGYEYGQGQGQGLPYAGGYGSGQAYPPSGYTPHPSSSGRH